MIQVILANAPNPKAAQMWSKFENEIKIAATDYEGTMIHRRGLLYLNLERIAASDAINKPYQILFHEATHAIDFLNRRGNRYFSEWYKDGAFLKAIKADFEALQNEEGYEKLRREWRKYPRLARAPLSDILSAQTNDEYNLGIGHSAQYWQEGTEAIKCREGLSDFAEAALANQSAYELLKRELPRANAVFEEMLEELLRS